MKAQAGTLVHGIVWSDGHWMGHAWVILEGGEYVFEPQSGQVLLKEQFYDRYQARELATYSPTDAMLNTMRLRSTGPWEDRAIVPAMVEIPMTWRSNVTQPVPRFAYHSVGMRGFNQHGGISAYKIREVEAADSFGPGYQSGKYIWLSPFPITKESVKIDLTQLDLAQLRLTGQVEGYMLYHGDIPKSALT